MSETQPTKTRFTAKVITFSAIALALATVIATFIKFKGPFWFNGGSITLFSMLIICMIGYWYGPAVGLTAAFAYSILQFITGPYVMHPAQVILDYPLAFTSLGLSGFFYQKKNGLLTGYIVGCLARLFFHCVSGAIFYTEYFGSAIDKLTALGAGIVYNMSYIIPEMILTILLISLPPVKSAIARVKTMAIQQ
ncbi:MAG: energy-coupled thiamine transporter ThiT [Lachnospiraceae bacterium]|nr:energy-coupled thiamine transporter ThiT [Lachnospiraceae bacterium]